LGNVYTNLFSFIANINNGFTSSFLAFYLLIPFYNKLIRSLNKTEHRNLIITLFVIYTISSTFFFNGTVFSYIGWYITIYLIAAYIRLYPESWMDNKFCGVILFSFVSLSYLSVIVVDFVGVKFGFTADYYMVSDSNKLFALIIGIFSFLFFKNLKIKNSKFINTIASTTFGVLCIHAASDSMRTFLWKDLLNVSGMYNMPFAKLVIISFVSVIAVFTVCSIIDIVRIYLLEKPFFKYLNHFEWFHKKLFVHNN